MHRAFAGWAAAALAAIASLASIGAYAGALQVVVVDKEGHPVPDAIVVLRPFSGVPPRTALPMHATINQTKMRFVPNVTLVALGATGTFVNNDPWEHHVRGSAAGILNFDADASGGFELRLDGKPDNKPARQAEVTFSKPGPILLGCHLHASMKGFVYVSDSPWAEITPDTGVASFDNVPSGPLFVRVWHGEQLIDLAPQQMTITNAPAKTTVQLSVVPRRRRV